MMAQKVGLVLEGGGMRGLYTTGVLDCFMDYKIDIDYVIGVSAGACNGVAYASNQRGRSLRVNTEYVSDKRYVSLSNFIKTKSVFGMDFLFNEITYNLDPIDFDKLAQLKCEFKIGVTDIVSGTTEYFGKECIDHDSTVLRASSSIPLFAPIVEYKGKKYLDGGTSDPIPVKKAIEDGCDKVIVVLTRENGFMRQPEKLRKLYSYVYKAYPNMIKVLDNRHDVYNASVEYAYKLKEEGKAIIIAPKEPLGIGRFEKKKENLIEAYNKGYQDALEQLEQIKEWMYSETIN
ncbi:MAG: patatin family protein [Oscillospiraceae bacterium]